MSWNMKGLQIWIHLIDSSRVASFYKTRKFFFVNQLSSKPHLCFLWEISQICKRHIFHKQYFSRYMFLVFRYILLFAIPSQKTKITCLHWHTWLTHHDGIILCSTKLADAIVVWVVLLKSCKFCSTRGWKKSFFVIGIGFAKSDVVSKSISPILPLLVSYILCSKWWI